MYQVGDLIAGYRVLQVLGHGGMGEVYQAAHPRLPRADAIKVLRSVHATDPVFRARFEREADLVAPLHHPNIVAVYDRGIYDDRLWIAMEFVPGRDAGLIVDADGPLDPRLAIAIITGAAAGLDAAHLRGILHRDIKPGNILVTPGLDPMVPDAVKLTDFGIAQALDEVTSLTGTGTTVGTLRYSSPEQIEGRRVDIRSDTYSLGATAYELLTGAPPFESTSLHGLMTAHMFGERPRATQRNPSLPDAVDAVLQQAMATSPDDRFATAGDFAAAFADAFDTRRTLVGPSPTRTPAPTPPDPAASRTPSVDPPRQPWFRRLPALGFVVVLVAAIIGGVAGLLQSSARTLPTPERPDAQVIKEAVQITWNAVDGADSYVVRQNGAEIFAGPGTGYTAPLPLPGTYTYTVAARSDTAPGSEFSLTSETVTVFLTWRGLQWVADLYPDLVPATPLSTNSFDGMICSGGGGSLAFPDSTQTSIDCDKDDAAGNRVYRVSVFAFATAAEASADADIAAAGSPGTPFTTTQGNTGTLHQRDTWGGMATLTFGSGPRTRTYISVTFQSGTGRQAADVMARLPI
ncbi:protein kinase domain-containing protein [Gordonia bronchialis]|uniref:protein kinase domain-containing protein n=1 Tax=Gordonia bronchialis TaxID=2054 RepID=UPI00243154FF|nr:protein kinase [Gordonia bronchialis]